MMYKRDYKQLSAINADNVFLTIHGEFNNKPNSLMYVLQKERSAPIALVTPACATHWQRSKGNGNLGTMYGPSDPMKAKFPQRRL